MSLQKDTETAKSTTWTALLSGIKTGGLIVALYQTIRRLICLCVHFHHCPLLPFLWKQESVRFLLFSLLPYRLAELLPDFGQFVVEQLFALGLYI